MNHRYIYHLMLLDEQAADEYRELCKLNEGGDPDAQETA